MAASTCALFMSVTNLSVLGGGVFAGLVSAFGGRYPQAFVATGIAMLAALVLVPALGSKKPAGSLELVHGANWLAVIGFVALALGVFVAALPLFVRQMLYLVLSRVMGFESSGVRTCPSKAPRFWRLTTLPGSTDSSSRQFRAMAKRLSMPVILMCRFCAGLPRRAGIIPIPSVGPKAKRGDSGESRASTEVRRSRYSLEAQISRNGLIGSFYRGIEVMLSDHPQVPVVPVYLDNLWGSVFSFSGGRFFRKRPQGWRRVVNVAFGPPVPSAGDGVRNSSRGAEASVDAIALRSEPPPPLGTNRSSALPKLEHPDLGLLAVSTPDFDQGGIHQTGHTPGTVGRAAPGVAFRVVDDSGIVLGPDAKGRLQARVARREGWHDVGSRRGASIGRDLFG